MKFEEFSSFFTGIGFRINETAACGLVGEYPTAVRFVGQKSATAVNITMAIGTALEKDQQKAMRKAVGKPIVFAADHLTITMQVGRSSLSDSFRATTSAALQFLTENRVAPAMGCPSCGGGNCDLLALVGEVFRPVHSSCLSASLAGAKEKAEQNDLHGNYLLGTLGGLVGGLIAIIPSFLTIFFAQRIYAILYLLIPLGIYQGYKMAKGRQNATAGIITALLSILCVFILEFAVIHAQLVSEFGSFPLSYTFQFFTDGEIFREVLTDMIPDFLFIALGIWACWGKIKQSAYAPVQNLESTLANALPNPRFMAPAGAPVENAAPVQPADPGVPLSPEVK